MTAALQAPLSMGFSRQEYGSGWPSPAPGIKPASPAPAALAGGCFTAAPPADPYEVLTNRPEQSTPPAPQDVTDRGRDRSATDVCNMVLETFTTEVSKRCQVYVEDLGCGLGQFSKSAE